MMPERGIDEHGGGGSPCGGIREPAPGSQPQTWPGVHAEGRRVRTSPAAGLRHRGRSPMVIGPDANRAVPWHTVTGHERRRHLVGIARAGRAQLASGPVRNLAHSGMSRLDRGSFTTQWPHRPNSPAASATNRSMTAAVSGHSSQRAGSEHGEECQLAAEPDEQLLLGLPDIRHAPSGRADSTGAGATSTPSHRGSAPSRPGRGPRAMCPSGACPPRARATERGHRSDASSFRRAAGRPR